MKSLACLLLLAVSVAAASCGDPRVSDLGSNPGETPTPTPTGTQGGPSLSSGDYTYVIDSAPANSCWGPSKNTPALPMTLAATVSVAGANVSISTVMMNATQTFDLSLAGEALSGGGSGDADLNANGVDCVLHIDSTFAGDITANDAFTAQQTISINTVSGAQCSLLVGSLSNSQFDALPCTLTLAGTGSKN